MNRPVWKKVQAKAALEAIAADLGQAFGIPAPKVYLPEWREGMEWEWRFDVVEVWTKAGQAETSVTISAKFAHLYFRFDEPARAVVFDNGASRLNRYSGKWNALSVPDAWMHNGKPCPATSLDVFRAELRRDFARVADPNPPAAEVAAYRAKEAERAAYWRAMREAS